MRSRTVMKKQGNQDDLNKDSTNHPANVAHESKEASVEGSDVVGIIEKLLPELLGPDKFSGPVIIERAHRLQDRHVRNTPRIFIVRFLSSKDKDKVLQTIHAQGKITYDEREVTFFQDIARETHLKRQKYYEVKQKLKDMDIRYGIAFPAKLRITHAGQECIFESPAEVENFISKIKDKNL